LVDTVDGMVGNAGQHFMQIGFGIETVEFSGGGWNELSKAPTTSNLVIYFRSQLHSAPE
jgi:hypothetical protein